MNDTASVGQEASAKARGWPKGKPRGPKKAAPEKQAPVKESPQKEAPKKVGPQKSDLLEKYSRFKDANRRPMGRTPTGRIEWSEDVYYIPPELKDPALSYEWRVRTVMGQEQQQNMARSFMDGWEPVLGEVFPQFGFPPGEPIEIGGLVLMARPAAMTAEAQEYRERAAKDQLRTQLRSLDETPQGELPRAGKGTRAEGDARLFSVKKGDPIAVRPDTKYEYDM